MQSRRPSLHTARTRPRSSCKRSSGGAIPRAGWNGAQVWASYRDGLDADLAMLDTDRRLHHAVAHAEGGNTGLACFGAWAEELTETGYLHNHARMWFASIWIFTLGLPWRIGADFFYRHLLDGDPASNTLGWRWLAGLHTRRKPYKAETWNIATFTAHRFAPRDSELVVTVSHQNFGSSAVAKSPATGRTAQSENPRITAFNCGT